MQRKRSHGLGGTTNLAVLAPIKSGMVPSFEPISYLERLRKVLDALHDARRNLRESELQAPIFPDLIGGSGIIRHFRYVLVPPPEAPSRPADGVWRLSLNVTFDGGWEPYMRVIYRDLGPLLDLLFCHSPDYPDSRRSTFGDYCVWVRCNELEGGLFYADSAVTLEDEQYSSEVEKAQRERSATEGELTRLALPSRKVRQREAMRRALADPVSALVLPLRTLKGLFRLSAYFPAGEAGEPDDMATLRHFAREVLESPRNLIATLNLLPADHPAKPQWDAARKAFADELAWLEAEPSAAQAQHTAAPQYNPQYDPSRLQSHPMAAQERITHGCVVLLRVDDAEKARRSISGWTAQCGPVPDGGIGMLIGFTYSGLQALKLGASSLDALPQEFVDGMEARCALLGDVRGNHPDHWSRPPGYGPSPDGYRIDLQTVHVFVHLRLADPAADSSHELHANLKPMVELLQEGTGLRVLAVQPTRSYRDKQGDSTGGHFGFADGLSQPVVATAGSSDETIAPRDQVPAGELLLGHANGRGDGPDPKIEQDPLLRDGSFLVVRSLRQYMDHLDAALAAVPPAQREDLLSRMMGRQRDGTPLAPLPAVPASLNDFDYATQAASDACPFQSHIRRANPRDGRPYMPRILRRGMSYGPQSDTDRTTPRGVMFMAYCASIAEQFEPIQRWIAGGNSSGVGSAQADPFLRVPQAGDSSVFRYLDASGAPVRVRFDDRPLVRVEWGLYLFVPALKALQALAEPTKPEEPKAEEQPYAPPISDDSLEAQREQVRQLLEDETRSVAAWEAVRKGTAKLSQTGYANLLETAYGKLLGRYDEVLSVMKSPGTKYSVAGYGDRMHKSIGRNLLGEDPTTRNNSEHPLNQAILSIDEEQAYEATQSFVTEALRQFLPLPSPDGSAARRPIDLVNFSDFVMAGLCTKWIGLPDGMHMVAGGRLDSEAGRMGCEAKPRCPGNFASASRYIFTPHPRPAVERAGQLQGEAVQAAVRAWLEGEHQLGTLAEKIDHNMGNPATEDLARSLAGVLLGFPPTVQGNFVRTLKTWIEDKSLWRHQQALIEAAPGPETSYAEAKDALEGRLLKTMCGRPVPEMLWRSPVDAKSGVDPRPENRIVLGIASALQDKPTALNLIFGRSEREDEPTVHGCPGKDIAIGVLLAMTAGLLKAGTLRPTGSPVLLILTPR